MFLKQKLSHLHATLADATSTPNKPRFCLFTEPSGGRQYYLRTYFLYCCKTATGFVAEIKMA